MTHHNNETLARTRAFFDKRAANWDSMISAGHAKRLQTLIEVLPISPRACVLDVGCGTGVLLPILRDMLGAAGRVVAADISFPMLQEADKRAAALHTNLQVPAFVPVQADVVQPPWCPLSFDWIICNSCFPHFHDQQQAMNTMAGLLKFGGRLVVCHTESRDAINQRHRTVGGEVGGHELPDSTCMGGMVKNAGLLLEQLRESSDAYMMTARKET